MLQKKLMLKWWLLIVLTASGCAVVNYFNGFEFLWANDFTKISFVIMALFVFGSALTGYKVFSYSKEEDGFQRYETEWLISEHLLSLGLLGTVVGLAFTFLWSFKDLDIGNVEASQRVISTMAAGLGASLMTTVTGLVFSMILKTQLVIAEGEDL